MIDIKEILIRLSSKRPIFHSEADFQHALAWEIHQKYPDSKIRLEYKPAQADKKCYVDIWIQYLKANYVIELKYKTRGFRFVHNNEEFDLLNQGAQDCGRYDVCKDIQRVERLVNKDTLGFVVFLTNDCSYWKIGRTETEDYEFRLHEGKMLSGILRWKKTAAPGTIRNREEPINIKGEYQISWLDYSKLNDSTYGQFKYLIIEVTI